MELNDEQFQAIAFIFEERNATKYGRKIGEFEKSFIDDFPELQKISIEQLERMLVQTIDSENQSEELRISAYWALSKTFNKSLINKFKKWLQFEIYNHNPTAIFQILIALDRFEEKVFHQDRDSRDYTEQELNIRDAKKYLSLFKETSPNRR